MLKQQATALAPRSATRVLRFGRGHSYCNATSNSVMLYLIGLGLADEADITVKGLELVKRVERVYLEAYTSILLVDTAKLVRPLFKTYNVVNLTLSFLIVGSILWPSNHRGRP